MGQRRMDQVFMPGKFVFPGGRLDKVDRDIASVDELRPVESAKLLLQMKGAPSSARARALALAAVRETFEETGILIAGAGPGKTATSGSPTWDAFFQCGYLPKIGGLAFLARAITPPGRPRRYDTRFFCVRAEEIAHKIEHADGELSRLDWLTIEDARGLDLPAITRVILEDLLEFLQAGQDRDNWPVPYYHHQNGKFRRDLLRIDPDPARLDTPAPLAMVPHPPADHH
jgi:8-oxo-dGTP pyrophosphatase MutT (NUDIX family)